MPAIDLARLRKQTAHLADLFDQPEAFLRALHEMLDFYVNRTLRDSSAVAPSSVLETYRTPSPILKHIENEIGPLAAANPDKALELANHLWDEGWLETRLLAATMIGKLPPHEERLLPRLTAWASQVRDPSVRATLLSTSLARLRKEAPEQFLMLVGEWLNPERQRMWSSGIQALIPLIRDPNYHNLPPVFDLLDHVVEAAPGALQNDLAEVLNALHGVSPTETIHFLRQILAESKTPMTAITIRRIFPLLHPQLVEAVRELVKSKQVNM